MKLNSGTYLGNLTVHRTVVHSTEPVLSIKSVLNSTCCTDLIWGTFENFNGEKVPEIRKSSPNNTACMTLALPRRTNIPRPTKKDPKGTPDHVFNDLACSITFGTEGVFRNSRVYGNQTQ